MMLVPYYIQPSNLHGLGIFAAADIPRGTVVWRYTEPIDRFFSLDEALAFGGSRFVEFLEHYGYMWKGDYEICGDGAIFWNFSPNPNCVCAADTEDVIAVRDIRSGEELTTDCYIKGMATQKQRLALGL